jgi:hypothetical protein
MHRRADFVPECEEPSSRRLDHDVHLETTHACAGHCLDFGNSQTFPLGASLASEGGKPRKTRWRKVTTNGTLSLAQYGVLTFAIMVACCGHVSGLGKPVITLPCSSPSSLQDSTPALAPDLLRRHGYTGRLGFIESTSANMLSILKRGRTSHKFDNLCPCTGTKNLVFTTSTRPAMLRMGPTNRDVSAAAMAKMQEAMGSAMLSSGIDSLSNVETILADQGSEGLDSRTAVSSIVAISKIQGKERIVHSRRIDAAMTACASTISKHINQLSVKDITQALRASGG